MIGKELSQGKIGATSKYHIIVLIGNFMQKHHLRTFVFQREDTQQITIVSKQLSISSQTVNLQPILQQHCRLEDHIISIYDPRSFSYTPIEALALRESRQGEVPSCLFQPQIILVRFRQKEPEPESEDCRLSCETTGTGGQNFSFGASLFVAGGDSFNLGNRSINNNCESKSRERTVGEVLELVKRWRDLHIHGDITSKQRLNLQDAAKAIGVSKKSLDDYYCQLRLGEFYNFDFVNHLPSKMRILRTFIKKCQKSISHQHNHNSRHPKNLKILSYFDLSTRSFRMNPNIQPRKDAIITTELETPLTIQSDKQSLPVERKGVDDLSLLQINDEQSPVSCSLFDFRDNFLGMFDTSLSAADPFYSATRDCRRKDEQYESSLVLFN